MKPIFLFLERFFNFFSKISASDLEVLVVDQRIFQGLPTKVNPSLALLWYWSLLLRLEVMPVYSMFLDCE
jgi:hypothetical protein